ncbi:O-methyltransferase [Shewanella baltica]|uniref:O-methyltransferase n=1 Tax=Shewanella baltica TaxID=62322 RepID=UPI00217EF209|nr:O-methyltransferase [Shewanella baltica]MCS6177750.1 hypothetical protein [Shewanella baltica]MCS6253896.1 hypothetical protein [Shewanella baltica]
MSSGSTIPYHLRQNKAVERALFIEQLKFISLWLKDNGLAQLEQYRYVGFGGPFLEDFKAIHRELNITSMVSIEVDADTLKRQAFNRPISCIELVEEPMTSSTYIATDHFEKETILWLDYVNFDYNAQLNDVRNAIAKMSDFDILKVTLNANIANIKGDPDNLQKSRLNAFVGKISSAFLPTEKLIPDNFTAQNFPSVLVKTVVNALNQGVLHKPNAKVNILSSFIYADGQKMLTLACMLTPSDFDTSALLEWEFSFKDEEILNISLPSLSTRERIEIERMLPQSGLDEIKSHLGYNIARQNIENDLLLSNFIKYYSRFPWFGKVVI